MTARSFHIGDILSVTTPHCVAQRGWDALYDLLDFLTGDKLMTHQLPRAAQEARPHLAAQHPDLAAVTVPGDLDLKNEAAREAWLAEQVARFGEHRDVTPVPPGAHEYIDPLVELHQMRSGEDR